MMIKKEIIEQRVDIRYRDRNIGFAGEGVERKRSMNFSRGTIKQIMVRKCE